MNFCEAKSELKQLLNRVNPSELPKLLDWMKNSDELDDLLLDNRAVILQNIADDLRTRLPLNAMLPSETTAQLKMQQSSRPTLHVDSFLYDEDQVDSLCEGGAMSRSYCLTCGSQRTAALGGNQPEPGAFVSSRLLTNLLLPPSFSSRLLLTSSLTSISLHLSPPDSSLTSSLTSFSLHLSPPDFVSHSFSVSELRFLFQNLLPDLSGRTLVDVGSRLGAVLYGGYVYSSASRLLGLEISEEFVRLQTEMLHKYQLTDRVQVLHADVRTQEALLQNADVLVMNNVFEYFMEPSEQLRAWQFIIRSFRKSGSLLVTVPSLQESLNALQEALQPGWVEELPVDYDVYLGRDTDADSLRQIHLYRVM